MGCEDDGIGAAEGSKDEKGRKSEVRRSEVRSEEVDWYVRNAPRTLIGPFGSSFVDGEEPGRRSGRCFADVVCADVVDRDVIGTNVVRVDELPLLAVMA